jgi:hypothetical protein
MAAQAKILQLGQKLGLPDKSVRGPLDRSTSSQEVHHLVQQDHRHDQQQPTSSGRQKVRTYV